MGGRDNESDMMDEFFDTPTKKEKAPVEEEVKQKALTMFDYLNDICHGKKGNIHKVRDPELKAFNGFMIMRFLSLDYKYIALINIINQYQDSISKEQLYKSLLELLPRSRKFFKYPKKNKGDYTDAELLLVQNYFNCSEEDALNYLKLGFFNKSDIKQIKIAFGGKCR